MRKTLDLFERISLAVIIILAFIGTMAVGTIAHELSHWNDYKSYVSTDYICLMDMPANGLESISEIRGTYYYSITNETASQNEISTIDKYTEIKAYTIQLILILILFICTTTIILLKRFSNKYNIQFFKK